MTLLFHIPTMWLCVGATTAIIGCFLTFSWWDSRGDAGLKYWSIGYWCLSIGSILLGLSSLLPPWLALGIGNFLIFVCLVLYGAGFQAYDGKPISITASALSPLIWSGLYAFWPDFQHNELSRVIVASVLVAYQSIIVSRIAWGGRVPGQHSVRSAVSYVFGAIAAAYLLRVAMVTALLDPVDAGVSIWPPLFMFISFLQMMFSAVAIFVLVRERAELRYRVASEVDELTGIFNRRAFISYVSAARADGTNRGALALLDIDHFKRINDTYGHGAGDEALNMFCAIVEKTLAPNMIFGRIGGEEFAIYFPGMGIEEAKIHCERIRKDVESCPIRVGAEQLHMTVSQGLCADVVGHAEVTFLFGLADRALYIAKRGGRNRVSALNPSSGLKLIAAKMAEKSVDRRGGSRPVRQPS